MILKRYSKNNREVLPLSLTSCNVILPLVRLLHFMNNTGWVENIIWLGESCVELSSAHFSTRVLLILGSLPANKWIHIYNLVNCTGELIFLRGVITMKIHVFPQWHWPLRNMATLHYHKLDARPGWVFPVNWDAVGQPRPDPPPPEQVWFQFFWMFKTQFSVLFKKLSLSSPPNPHLTKLRCFWQFLFFIYWSALGFREYFRKVWLI